MTQTNEKRLSRRDMLKGAAATAVGLATTRCATKNSEKAYKSVMPASVVGANERVLTGHIGIGAMGRLNLGIAIRRPDVQPIAVCDLWAPHREFALQAIQNAGAPNGAGHVYHEELLENRDIDAVVISTPDHWHCIPVLMACDAGKDIYCEKPLATTVREGRAMVEAVRTSGRVFQGGTMQRSGEHFKEAVELVQNGDIGEVHEAETWINLTLPKEGMGPQVEEPAPEGLDWERYLGWTPQVPYNRHRFIANFRWFLDYSGGWVTDWGVHLMDIVFWAMGDGQMPKSVTAAGGKYYVTDERTTPDTLRVLYDFDDYIMTFSNRLNNGTAPYGGKDHGIVFFGDRGTLHIDRSGYTVTPLGPGTCEPKERGASDMNGGHWDNFVACIRSRERPICDVETLHNTTTISHMGTAAWHAGGKLEWDSSQERFRGGDRDAVKKANALIYRQYLNGWSLKAPYNSAWG